MFCDRLRSWLTSAAFWALQAAPSLHLRACSAYLHSLLTYVCISLCTPPFQTNWQKPFSMETNISKVFISSILSRASMCMIFYLKVDKIQISWGEKTSQSIKLHSSCILMSICGTENDGLANHSNSQFHFSKSWFSLRQFSALRGCTRESDRHGLEIHSHTKSYLYDHEEDTLSLALIHSFGRMGITIHTYLTGWEDSRKALSMGPCIIWSSV